MSVIRSFTTAPPERTIEIGAPLPEGALHRLSAGDAVLLTCGDASYPGVVTWLKPLADGGSEIAFSVRPQDWGEWEVFEPPIYVVRVSPLDPPRTESFERYRARRHCEMDWL